MRSWSIAAAVVLFAGSFAGCGQVRDADGLGEPIFRISGQLQGAAIPQPEGQLRAVLGWLSFGGGAYVDCLQDHLLTDCFDKPSYESRFTLRETEVQALFPSQFEIPLWSFPEEDVLLIRNDARMAIGGLGVYDDRNMNGKLDPIPADSTTPIDRVLAESIITDLRSVIVFREGAVHPMWNVIRDTFGCPEPPVGYSVARIDENFRNCRVTAGTPLLMTTSDEMSTNRVLCGGPLADYSFTKKKEEPPAEPPENAAGVVCSDNGLRISFFIDEGRVCDRFRRTIYSLAGCDPAEPSRCWDYRAMPPSWWPCD